MQIPRKNYTRTSILLLATIWYTCQRVNKFFTSLLENCLLYGMKLL